MRTRFRRPAVLALVAIGSMAFSYGGWAVITIDDLPESVTAGKPVSVAFTVRQHGVTPLGRLSPNVQVASAAKGAAEVTATAAPSGAEGHYVANVVVPRPGNWIVTVNSGFGPSHVTLYPIPAVATGARAPSAAPAAEVGKRLFAAKGCVTCHVHDAVKGFETVSVGPNLTPKRYQAEYLARFLADPSIARTPGQQFQMPALGLKPAEIAALVAFINTDHAVATR